MKGRRLRQTWSPLWQTLMKVLKMEMISMIQSFHLLAMNISGEFSKYRPFNIKSKAAADKLPAALLSERRT